MPLEFDISKCPFSRFGSYFSLSIIDWGSLGPGLYLHTHRGGSAQAFRIDPVRDGQAVAFETVATPSRLTLKPAGGGEVELVFCGTGEVRVRGRGVSLRLEMPKERWTTAWELPGGAWALNMSKHGVQLALEALEGRLTVDAPWGKFKGFCRESLRMVATLDPAESGSFEAAIDEFVTAWVRPARPGFDACCEDVARQYERWTQGLPEAPAEYAAARDLAGYVNWSATVDPSGHLTRRTMLMSKMGMCNVYHWDHAFNAMAHCSHDPDLAWEQLMVMWDRRDAYGKCPSSMNDREIRYTVSNPPVQGWALRRMWDENPAMMTVPRMLEAYEYLAKWSDWLCNHRTWPGELLPFYTHGFDSGWDNSTIFDDGVPIVTPDQPAYLILQLEVLADLADALNMQAGAASWRSRRDAMLAELLATLWKGGRFVGVRKPSGEVVQCESLLTCMPIVLGRRLPADVRAALVARIREHLTPWGLATEKPSSGLYEDNGYWRGPIWAPSTMLIVTGLLDIGQDELAGTIVRAFCRMCAEHGFYENFDAKTGAGCWDTAYTWTSSVFMIFASAFLKR